MATDCPYPILEFDQSPEALIEPSRLIRRQDVPEYCVLCFFCEAIDVVVAERKAKQVRSLRSEMGPHPVYEVDLDGRRLVLLHPRIGAPFAALTLEALIAMGCSKFIVCGGAGVLQPEIAVGHLVVPTVAVRDEGTSYHYLPPSREVSASPDGVAAIEKTLAANDCEYLLAKTWTTDAPYRETADKIGRRRAEGCVTVEMEAAALFAVAQFRGVTLAQVLYGGDDCSGETWAPRDWQNRRSARERLLWLAMEACLSL